MAITHETAPYKITPMQQLRHYLSKFDSLPHVKKTVLNRQRQKCFGWSNWSGADCFQERKPIATDCIYLYEFENQGASFAFSFNYRNLSEPFLPQPMIRASVRLSKESGVEYSQQCSINEMKWHLRSFFAEHDVDQLSKYDFHKVPAFIQEFSTFFKITLSENLSHESAKKHREAAITRLSMNKQESAKVKAEISGFKHKNSPLSEKDELVFKGLLTRSDFLEKERQYISGEELKDYPEVVRQRIYKDFSTAVSW